MTWDQHNSSAVDDVTNILFASNSSSWLLTAATGDDAAAINSSSSSSSASDGVVGELDLSVIERFRSNRRVNDFAFFCLVAAYCVLIVFGTIGNSLVVYVVARQPAMRTARNVFVVNLAISDLLLCLITMPLTLMEIRSYTWPLGNSPVSCKMVGSLQAVSIFVSTLSITAIALDRYQLIVYPTKRSFQLTGALLALAGIWALGIVLALPLFIVRTLEHHDIPIPNSPISSVDYCLEEWPNERGRSLYSIGSILVQYALPIITVSVAHARISNKLQVRMASLNHQQQLPMRQHSPINNDPGTTVRNTISNGQQQTSAGQNNASRNELNSAVTDGRTAAREEKLRKTNTLLIAISIIFTICWLPMNTFNVVEDTWNVFGDDTETMLIVYAVCHMVGMSSACANPLLYGWLNDNFRKEFHRIGTSFIAKRRNQTGARDMTGKPPGEMLLSDKASAVKRLDVSVIVEIRDDHHQQHQLGVAGPPPLIVCGTPQTLRPSPALLTVPSINLTHYQMKEMTTTSSTAENDVIHLTGPQQQILSCCPSKLDE